MDPATAEIRRIAGAALPEAARATVAEARARPIAEALPGLPRQIGRAPLGPAGRVGAGGTVVDLGAWRRCDAAALLVLGEAAGNDLGDLFAHGDLEERTMVLRCVGALPLGAATGALIDEAQRTNTGIHFEAALLDSNLLVRALEGGTIDEARFNSALLKIAFLGLPLRRAIDAERGANPELSRMLQDLATEREAATRAVWPDTDRLLARAPVAGTVARVAGGLEHGDDGRRLAAAEAAALLARPDLAAFARERLAREPRPEIRAVLQRAVETE